METITYYETLLPVEEKILQLENNPTQQNLIAAQNAVQGVTSYAKEDTILDYQQRISDAKNNNEIIKLQKLWMLQIALIKLLKNLQMELV